jgi:predicted O-methyltransferase YrrM
MPNEIYHRIKGKLRQVLRGKRSTKDKRPTDAFDDQEEEKARQIGIDLQAAESRLNEVLRSLGRRPFNYAKNSIHWVLGAAVGQRFAPRRILELGTRKGEFTEFLARLYPSAEICTVDLPANDPIRQKAALRGRHGNLVPTLIEARARSTNHPNIQFIETNSLFLLDRVSGPFDFIFVDAGHRYPDVAWDIAYAYHLCRPDGIIMADDVTLDPSFEIARKKGADTSIVLQYLAIRAPITLQYFLRRRNMTVLNLPRVRDFVAWIDKSIPRTGDHAYSAPISSAQTQVEFVSGPG